jgi:hypothetical protein
MQLQETSLDLAKALLRVNSLRDVLKSDRQSSEQPSLLFAAAQNQCQKCSIEMTPAVRRQRQLSRRLQNSVVIETVGCRPSIDSEHSFVCNLYNPVLDALLTELNDRFSNESIAIMCGIQALNPVDNSFLKADMLEPFAVIYSGNTEDLRHECHQLKRVIERAGKERTNLTSLLCLAQFLEPYRLAFHEIFRLVKIALVLPVSSAACERSFSALKLIKTHLRSTMSDIRLGNISILSVESRRANCIDLNAFVDEFDSNHCNRKLLLH